MKLKSLTDEEQRDLRLKVVTAKVNSEDIKSEYLYEEYLRASANGTDNDTKVENGIAMNNRVAEDNTRSTRDKNATNNRNKGDNTNRNLQTSGGLVSSIVSLFKKAFSGGETATTKNNTIRDIKSLDISNIVSGLDISGIAGFERGINGFTPPDVPSSPMY